VFISLVVSGGRTCYVRVVVPPGPEPTLSPFVSFTLLLTSPSLSYSRKAAKLAHPDKGGSEAKMAALNEAYEVLSNPELRARFDAGEDPMDPSANNG
jgi:hypothetical protein